MGDTLRPLQWHPIMDRIEAGLWGLPESRRDAILRTLERGDTKALVELCRSEGENDEIDGKGSRQGG